MANFQVPCYTSCFSHFSGFKQVFGGRVNHMNAKEVEKCHARPKVQMTPRATLASHISYRSPRREDYLITEGTLLQKFTCKLPKKQRISMETKNHFHLRNLSHKIHCWWNTLLQDPKHHPTSIFRSTKKNMDEMFNVQINVVPMWKHDQNTWQRISQNINSLKILSSSDLPENRPWSKGQKTWWKDADNLANQLKIALELN